MKFSSASALGLMFFLFVTASRAEIDADFNPFTDSYISHRPVPTESHNPPRIHVGQDKVADYQRLLEDGYDLQGYSSFEAGDVPVSLLTAHATQIKADVAMIYTNGLERLPASIRQQRIRIVQEREQQGLPPQVPAEEQFYEYFVAYWTKLPMPMFGSHVQRYTQGGETPGGLEVLAVIRNSSAARSGIQPGDVLKQMGDIPLNQAEHLMQAVQKYAGQTVEVQLERNGKPELRKVELARPQ